MSKVALIRCSTYDEGAVKAAVESGLRLLGGPERFAAPGEKILLKPNLLVGDPPEKCVTTHPSVFGAVAECFMAAGSKISYGDSPAMGSPGKVSKKAGLTAIAEKLDLPLADFTSGETVFFKDGRQNKKFVIAKGVLDCDGVISIPKLKTHGLERMTGSIKNQFGCIPGMRKGEYHVKLPDANDFAKMLVDLNRFIGPRLYIMDGIRAMEGNGPRGGTPVDMNVLLFSEDPVALDATVCRLIDLNPEYVPTIRFGYEFGSGTYLEAEIELLGDSIDDFKTDAFDVKKRPVRPFKQKGFYRFLNNRLVEKPYIEEERCTRCGTCVQVCPADPKAVNWPEGNKSKAPVYNYDDCIRCYCCQELCPESAVMLKKPMMRKLLGYVAG